MSLMGHNNPPSEIEILEDRLNNFIEEKKTLKRLEEFNIPDVIDNDSDANFVTDHIKSIKNFHKRIKSIHKEIKAPYLECSKKVDSWKKDFEKKINFLEQVASKPLNDFLRKKAEEEAERLRKIEEEKRKEAEALAEEAKAHADAGIEDTANELLEEAIKDKVVADRISDKIESGKLAKSRGFIATSSQSKVWKGTIVDYDNLDLELLRRFISKDELQKAVNRAVKTGIRDIKGVDIEEDIKLNVR